VRILEVGPDHVTFALLGAIYRACIKACDFAIWLVGATGVFKSELAALAQQHYGASMGARHLPGNFASTANALESLAFLAKDALLVVDDFAPHGGTQDVARYHATADRLLRAAGNNQGRGRLSSDAKLREARPPRGLVVTTGEDLPRGQSIHGRTFVIEVGHGDIHTDVLTRCQKDAASGLYAEAMGAFVQFIAGQYDQVQEQLQRRAVELRAKAAHAHSRTPGIVAELAAAFGLFMQLAVTAGAISKEQANELNSRCWNALKAVALQQRLLQSSSEPAQRFLELVRSAVTSGAAHVARMDGEIPPDPTVWGWRNEGSAEHSRWIGKGRRIGWIDEDDLYLEPNAAHVAAQELGQRTGEPLTITQTVINKRCHEAGFLLTTDKKRGTLTIRKRVQGSSMPVLHLSAQKFLGDVGFLGGDGSRLSGKKVNSDNDKTCESNSYTENVGNVGKINVGDRAGETREMRPGDLFPGQDVEVMEI
jgi:hypothetical protein